MADARSVIRRMRRIAGRIVRRFPAVLEFHGLLVLLVLLAVALRLISSFDPVATGCLVLTGAMLWPKPALTEPPPYSIGLPGMPDGPPAPSRMPSWTVTAVRTGVLVAALALAAAQASGGWFVALLALSVVGWLAASDAALRTWVHRRRLRHALTGYAPTIAMAFAGRSGGPWQLRMWEPYLLASGEPGVIVNVHEKYMEMIVEGGDLTSPFIQLGPWGVKDLPTVLVPSLTSLYYVQNAQRNAGFMAHERLTHVWLNHGDSDKPANFNPRHALYDVLVVCGQAGIDRYARHGIDIPREKFEVLGRPQASGVQPARGPIGTLEQPTVLYAPTWHGLDEAVNFSSLERGPQIVRELLGRGVTVIFRPHPLSYRWKRRRDVVEEIQAILQADRDATGRRHVWGQQADQTWSVVDCANHADALISDVSSVVSDFLQSEKPYAMTSMRASVEDFRAEYSVAETGYVILGDLSNLREALDDLLGADPMAEARSERKRYVLGDFTGQESAEAFAAFVRRVVATGR